MILDEAQNIKNPKSDTAVATKRVPARVKLALTGTPLENSIYELWSIVDFIMPGYLGTLETFKDVSADSFFFRKYKCTKQILNQILNISHLGTSY